MPFHVTITKLTDSSQVLRSWRTRRLLDTDILDAILAELDSRKETFVLLPLHLST